MGVRTLNRSRQWLNAVRTQIPALLEREAALSTTFHLVPVFIGIGAVFYFTANAEPDWYALLGAVALMIGLRATFRRTALALVANASLLIAGGAIAAKFETLRHEQTVLAGELSTNLTGKVITAEKTERGKRIVLELIDSREPELKHTPKNVRVSLSKTAPAMSAGDVIELRARLQPPGGPVRPDGYDFAFNAWFSEIGATGFATGPVTIVEKGSRSTAAVWLENLRASISERVRTVIGGEAGDVAAALITGVQAGIGRDTAEAMRISGLAHVLSISGLHMALAAAIFLFGIRGAFALFPAAAQRLPVKKIAAALALVSCTFYLALSGAGVATVRSWIMIAVMLAAILLDRPALTMRNLAIAAIFILILSPHEAMGPSFQLSFAATAALISAYASYAQWRSEAPHTMPPASLSGKIVRYTGRAIGGAALTSLVAGLATTLFSVWHFNRLAPLGLPANLASMVPVSLVIMPSAVFAMLLMPFGLDTLPLQVMGWGVKTMTAIAFWFASVSPDISNKAMPLAAFLFGVAALLILISVQTKLRLVAIVPAILAFGLALTHETPDMLVSEDGKLVVVRLADGQFATNLQNVPRFTNQVWSQSLGTSGFAKPAQAPDSDQPERFYCSESVCRMTRKDSLRVVWQDYPLLAELEPEPVTSELEDRVRRIEDEMKREFQARTLELCKDADLLIINGPTRNVPCGPISGSNPGPIILSAKDLALSGATEVRIKTAETNPTLTDGATKTVPETISLQKQKPVWTADIRHAIRGPSRPWHRDRAYSKAARNMPPFRPIRQKLEELQQSPDAKLQPGTQ